jgi:hypothetical protein
MENEPNIVRKFSTEEIGDMIKSKRNLIYLFKVSGKFIRLLSSFEGHVHSRVFEGRIERT